MEWIYLIIASFGEIFGVMSINLYLNRRSIFWLLMIIVSMVLGFLFLSLAMMSIPLGNDYSIWTGLRETGAVLSRIVFFKVSASFKCIIFLICIITGAVGLKVNS